MKSVNIKFNFLLTFCIKEKPIIQSIFISGSTPFNRETGYLSRDNIRSVWRGNNNHDKEKIPLEGSDIPIRSLEQTKRHRESNKYIEFTPTDVYKDIAQSTGIYKFKALLLKNKFIQLLFYVYFQCHSLIHNRSKQKFQSH